MCLEEENWKEIGFAKLFSATCSKLGGQVNFEQ